MARLSDRLVVMSGRAVDYLREIYQIPADKIDLIPHGIPDTPFVDSNFYKDQYGLEGKTIILTFGLLSPNKGIEHAIRALPMIVEHHPDVVYMVLGATHPNVIREQGEAYRKSLVQLARDLGVARHVMFIEQVAEPRTPDGIHRRGGHLCDAIPQRAADRVGHAGLRHGRRQGSRVDAVLVRRGVAGRGPRSAHSLGDADKLAARSLNYSSMMSNATRSGSAPT